jgi:hypothetical protein
VGVAMPPMIEPTTTMNITDIGSTYFTNGSKAYSTGSRMDQHLAARLDLGEMI